MLSSEVVFRPAEPRHVEFTYHTLDVAEDALVRAFTSWDQPEIATESIEFIHGRSIVIRSPDRTLQNHTDHLYGKFDGLQIYGAGGSKQMIREGVFAHPKQFEISSLDPTNYSHELEEITQLQDFDRQGHLILQQRPYVPLHGMDGIEAENRKMVTALLQEIIDANTHTLPLFVVVPKLAAEGIFPDKKDANGKPLRFQAYRVPLVDRFPGQFIQSIQQNTIEQSLYHLGIFSFLSGKLQKILHSELGIAYMDAHVGNMSLLSSKNMFALYATDLGSGKQIANHEYKKRFMGLDAYMFLESTRRLVDMCIEFLAQQKLLISSPDESKLTLLMIALSGFAGGYFDIQPFGNNHRLAGIIEASTSTAESILDIVAKTYLSPSFHEDFIIEYERRFLS